MEILTIVLTIVAKAASKFPSLSLDDFSSVHPFIECRKNSRKYIHVHLYKAIQKFGKLSAHIQKVLILVCFLFKKSTLLYNPLKFHQWYYL
jgi:hypothetical protein